VSGSSPHRPVHVLDDDIDVVRSISLVLDSAGMTAEEWTSPRIFLRRAHFEPPTCVLLDVRMPGMTGPEVQEELRLRGQAVPVVFLTAHADVPTTVRAMKGGAEDFLLKPIDPAALLDAVRRALARSVAGAAAAAWNDTVHARFEHLTPREKQVFEQIARGASNKDGAAVLGITVNTMKVHRIRIMGKMEAASFADLVQMGVTLGLVGDDGSRTDTRPKS